jgi:hypothetical protein
VNRWQQSNGCLQKHSNTFSEPTMNFRFPAGQAVWACAWFMEEQFGIKELIISVVAAEIGGQSAGVEFRSISFDLGLAEGSV